MGRFRKYRRGLWSLGLIGVGLLAVGAACSEAEPPGDARPRPVSVSASPRLAAPVDTAGRAASVLDSLFFDHDLAAFAVAPFDSADAAHWVDSMMAVLTEDQKIGQLFIVHLPEPGLITALDDDALQAVQAYGVGGFLVPRLLAPRVVFQETQRLQAVARVPLFFAADYERGAGRFNNALTDLPSNMALGATRDTLLAAAAGRLTALEARALGVNLLFAPVVDVNNNPANPIINIRSYGEDPDLVGRMAAAFVREAERYGTLTTLKHFPGHGNTEADSHAKMGVVRGDAASLDSVELYPYRQVLRSGYAPAGVMTAHLWVPALDPEPVPATFSRHVLHDLLRDSLGFGGFVVTDDIRMGALRDTYSAEERTVRPLQAGADVILTPRSLPKAIKAVRAALRRGALDAAALDGSVRRVLTAKARAGLHRRRLADAAALDYLLERPRGGLLARSIADRAVTLLKTGPVLPLGADQRVALVQIRNVNGAESIDAAMDAFAAALGAEADVRLERRPSKAASEAALRAARSADVVVLALYLRLQSGRGDAGLFPRQEDLVRQLLRARVPVVLVTFGNPYAVMSHEEAEVLLVAYEQSLESVAAAAGVLRGVQPSPGRLPITVGSYAFGSGLPGVE